jgi:hypothetical protein
MESADLGSTGTAGMVSVGTITVSFCATWLNTILAVRSVKTKSRIFNANFVCAKLTQNVQLCNFA